MKESIDKKLEAILEMMKNGGMPSTSHIIPMLKEESVLSRTENSALLALVFFVEGTAAAMEKAKILIQRAWELSGGAEELLHIYVAIHASLKDTEAIRNAYKRIGMIAATSNDVDGAIRNFNLWHNAYAMYDKVDRYAFDYDILDAMRRLTEPLRIQNHKRTVEDNTPIRIGYLINGLTSVGSVLIKINCVFAEFHDQNRFHVVFYTPETFSTVDASPVAKKVIKLIKGYGCELVTAPDCKNKVDSLLALSQKISDARTDILITIAALADFEHYFLALLKPAPILIGFIFSSISQYITSIFDWGITASSHTLKDVPVNCSAVPIEMRLPQKETTVPEDVMSLNAPPGSVVVMILGRTQKFQCVEFIRTLTGILAGNENVFLVFVGVNAEQIPFDKIEFSETLMPRMKFISWTGDYMKFLRLADVVIDTYPYGGGVVLLEAMALEIPIMTFADDDIALFDQMNWSAAAEFLLMQRLPELIAPRGNFKALQAIANRLIRDSDFRKQMGIECRQIAIENYSMPSRMVHRCEDIYVKVLEMKQKNELDDCAGPCIGSKGTSNLSPFKFENLNAGSFRAYALLSKIAAAPDFYSAAGPVLDLGALAANSPELASKLAGRIESLPIEDTRKWMLLFYFYHSCGNAKKVIAFADLLLARKCVFQNLFYWKGLALRNENRLEEAGNAFISEITSFPNGYSAIPSSLEAGMLTVNSPTLSKLPKIINTLQIEDTRKWMLLFYFYHSCGRSKEIVVYAELLSTHGCPFPNLFYWKGLALRNENRLEEAGSAFISEITSFPNEYSAITASLEAGLLAMNLPGIASKLAETMEFLEVDNTRKWTLLFHVYHSLGNSNEVIALSGLLLEHQCTFQNMFYWRGLALRNENRLEEAGSAFISEITSFPNEYSAITASLEAGLLAMNLPGIASKFAGTIEFLEIDNTRKWTLLLHFYHSQGNSKEVIALSGLLLEHQCTFQNLLYWRGIAFRKQSMIEEASHCFEDELSIYGETGFILLQKAILLKCQNRLSDAEKLLNDAVSSYPDTEWIRCEMGLILEKEGRLDEALIWFLQEEDWFPGKKIVRDNIRRVKTPDRQSE